MREELRTGDFYIAGDYIAQDAQDGITTVMSKKTICEKYNAIRRQLEEANGQRVTLQDNIIDLTGKLAAANAEIERLQIQAAKLNAFQEGVLKRLDTAFDRVGGDRTNPAQAINDILFMDSLRKKWFDKYNTANAEVERLRELVESAFKEAYVKGYFGDTQKAWLNSEAMQALAAEESHAPDTGKVSELTEKIGHLENLLCDCLRGVEYVNDNQFESEALGRVAERISDYFAEQLVEASQQGEDTDDA